MNEILTCINNDNCPNLTLYKQYEVENGFDGKIWIVDDCGGITPYNKNRFIASNEFDFLKEDNQYLHIKLPKKHLIEKYKYCTIDADGLIFHVNLGEVINRNGRNTVVGVGEMQCSKILHGLEKMTPITVSLDNDYRKDDLFKALKDRTITVGEYINKIEQLK